MSNYLSRNRRDPRAVRTPFKYPRSSSRRSQDSSDPNSNVPPRSTRRSSHQDSEVKQQPERRDGQGDGLEQGEVEDDAGMLREDYSPVSQSPSSTSFLVCVVCHLTPAQPPLYGCQSSHIVCSSCRAVGGSLLSCPQCGSSNLQHRLVVAEELLRTEVELNRLVYCPFRSVGCEKITRTSVMREHRDSCLFRPVRCPKVWFSLSCSHTGPLYTIQQHARDQHNLHQGITVLQPGLIASKMFDTSANSTCCDDPTSAKFQPLELTHGDKLFYCYFERIASRKIWTFFIRMFDTEEQSKRFQAVIMIGHSGLERLDYKKAGIRFTGPVAHYLMKKKEVKEQGLMTLTVSDEYLKSCKVENVLFRIWFQVQEKS